MKEFSFRFVAEEGIKVDFIQASPTEVVFRVYRDDTTTTDVPNVNVSEKDNTVVEIREEAVSETTKKSNRHHSGAKQIKLTNVERFLQMWDASNVSVSDIMIEFNVSRATVYRWASQLTKRGPASKKKCSYKRIDVKQLVPDKLAGKTEHFVQMWNNCVPIAEIANEFAVHAATIHRWASQIPECISPEEKKQKRAAMKQMATVTTDGNTSRPSPEPMHSQTTSSSEDWPKSGERLRQNEIAALCKMWEDGQHNVTELARYFQVSRSTIYYQLRVNGCRGK